jgi:hypothetical protein
MTDTIALSPALQEQLEQVARRQDKSVNEVVKAAVETYLHAQHREAIAREMAAYERMHPDLIRSHRGKWVAIFDGKLIDSDDDVGRLHGRVRSAYASAPVLITPVEDTPITTLHLRSPRLLT